MSLFGNNYLSDYLPNLFGGNYDDSLNQQMCEAIARQHAMARQSSPMPHEKTLGFVQSNVQKKSKKLLLLLLEENS